MPTYTYQCDACGHGFDAVQRFSDDPLSECPECGSPVRRVIQPVGVVFKGSGWYITDSRPKSSSDGADGASSAKAASTSDKDKGSEKPAKTEKAEKTPVKVGD
jgi:putative FmdB family regulatory protein